jgi:hypothetical protein
MLTGDQEAIEQWGREHPYEKDDGVDEASRLIAGGKPRIPPALALP